MAYNSGSDVQGADRATKREGKYLYEHWIKDAFSDQFY